MVSLGIDIGGSSVKALSIDEGGGVIGTASSVRYSEPDRAGLTRAIKECVAELDAGGAQCVGLCLPGRVNPERTAIETAVNLPALNNWAFDKLLASVSLDQVRVSRVVSDADAAGYDFVTEFPVVGRTAAVSLGTGVGLCVLDGDEIVTIGDVGIGHLGHMDVGRIGEADRIGRDGSRNTLESFIGARALGQWMDGQILDFDGLTSSDTPIRAIVHALRVVHAIYRPHRIVLLGGVGLALKPHAHMMAGMISDGLTQLAAKGWTLEFATSAHHAACGAAKLAAQSS